MSVSIALIVLVTAIPDAGAPQHRVEATLGISEYDHMDTEISYERSLGGLSEELARVSVSARMFAWSSVFFLSAQWQQLDLLAGYDWELLEMVDWLTVKIRSEGGFRSAITPDSLGTSQYDDLTLAPLLAITLRLSADRYCLRTHHSVAIFQDGYWYESRVHIEARLWDHYFAALGVHQMYGTLFGGEASLGARNWNLGAGMNF